MILHKHNSNIIRFPVSEHKDFKNDFLREIENSPGEKRVNGLGELISETDYQNCDDLSREYVKLFFDVFNPYIRKLIDTVNSNSLDVKHIWYQKYIKNDIHTWHVHADCMFAGVYFLDMPNSKSKTELYDIYNKKIIDYQAKEGDLIIFPSFIPHRSNYTPSRKTVISFNINYDTVNLERIKT
tara:strand:+ start:238 stop:786 length:549 start_codon:yes stop_codon:yes gene_type:complete